MGTFLLHLVVFFQHLAVVPYQLAMVLQRSAIGLPVQLELRTSPSSLAVQYCPVKCVYRLVMIQQELMMLHQGLVVVHHGLIMASEQLIIDPIPDIFGFIMTVLLHMFKWFLHHFASLL